MKDSEQIKAFLDYLREASQQYRQAQRDHQLADDETQDILHRLELYEDDYRETVRLGKLLRQVRRERRKAKETCERLKPIADWDRDNQHVEKGLERLLGAVRKTEEVQEHRMWMPKTEILHATKTKGKENEHHESI